MQLIHGAPRLSNICQTPDGDPVFFDFGFSAVRPRIHDLAYASVFVILGMEGGRAPQSFAWDVIPALMLAYERAADTVLLPDEHSALSSYAVAVLLYHAALDGFTADPVGILRSRLPWIRLGQWLVDNPNVLKGRWFLMTRRANSSIFSIGTQKADVFRPQHERSSNPTIHDHTDREGRYRR